MRRRRYYIVAIVAALCSVSSLFLPTLPPLGIHGVQVANSETAHHRSREVASTSPFATGFASNGAGSYGPIGLAFDRAGSLFVMDQVDAFLYRFGSAGGAASGATRVNAEPIPGGPVGLAFSSDGYHLYLARRDANDVVEVDVAHGTIIREVASGIPGAEAIAIDPRSGDLIVTRLSPIGGLARIHDPQGPTPPVSDYASDPGLAQPDGITAAPDGTFYVATQTGHVYRVAGTASTSPAPGTATLVADLVGSDGIAVSSSGTYLIDNRTNGHITKINLMTTPLTTEDITVTNSRGDFVTVGPDGCLYADQSDSVIKVTNADGTCSLAPTLPATPPPTAPPSTPHPSPTLAPTQTPLAVTRPTARAVDLVPPGTSQSSPRQGLLDWWKAEGNARDSAGPHHGVLHAIQFRKGVVGQAFSFEGRPASFIDFGSLAGNFGRRDFSIQFWVKIGRSQNAYILGKHDICSNASFWEVSGGPGGLRLEVNHNGAGHLIVRTHHKLNDGYFHLITFVRRGTVLRAYTDAQLDDAIGASGVADLTNNESLIAGQSSCGPPSVADTFKGQLDEVKLYPTALSEDEITLAYAFTGIGDALASILTVQPGAAAPGDTITIKAAHLPRSTTFNLKVDNQFTHINRRSNSYGALAPFHYTVPPNLALGPHRLELVGANKVTVARSTLILYAVTHSQAPQGRWISPGTQRTVAIRSDPTMSSYPTVSSSWFSVPKSNILLLVAHAYPASHSGLKIRQVIFSAQWHHGQWHQICLKSSPSRGDLYRCKWDIVKSGVRSGTVKLSFDVYDSGGHRALHPDGYRSGIVLIPASQTVWVSPRKSFTVSGRLLHLVVHASLRSPQSKAIKFVEFTALWGGHWHQACLTTGPPKNTGDVYSCDWNMARDRVPDGALTLSFNIYDIARHVHQHPDGYRHGHIMVLRSSRGSETTPWYIKYAKPDENNCAVGVESSLTAEDLGRKTNVSGSIDITLGYERGHLLPASLGGSNTNIDNFVNEFPRVNDPIIAQFEARARLLLSLGFGVSYHVHVSYDSGQKYRHGTTLCTPDTIFIFISRTPTLIPPFYHGFSVAAHRQHDMCADTVVTIDNTDQYNRRVVADNFSETLGLYFAENISKPYNITGYIEGCSLYSWQDYRDR